MGYEKLSSDRLGESSASIRERMPAARERQRVRFEDSDIVRDSDMHAVMSQLNLSARGYYRVLKLARILRKSRRAGDCGSGGV